jgi:hypothetical protein
LRGREKRSQAREATRKKKRGQSSCSMLLGRVYPQGQGPEREKEMATFEGNHRSEGDQGKGEEARGEFHSTAKASSMSGDSGETR